MGRQSIRDRRKLEDKILVITGIVCLMIFCVGGFLLLNYYVGTRKQEKMNAQLAELKHGSQLESFIYVEALPLEMSENSAHVGGAAQNGTTSGQINGSSQQGTQVEQYAGGEPNQADSLKEINSDYVFWLQIPDTEIDYPVVQRDNDYYLKRDFFGKKNKHGTIFLDERCSAEGEFLLLHGHNMKDGTMFGSLRDFKKRDFAAEHGELIISPGKKDVHFEIVAAMLVDLYDADRFVYEELPTTEDEVQVYFRELDIHSLWCEEIIWEPGQKVVLLSTCDYGSEEERFVVVAIEKK